jgi:uncharacterized membrane protein
MKLKIIPPIFSVLGLICGLYTGVWVASFIEGIYSPYASGSDDLDSFFITAMAISCSLVGLLFSFAGFRIGNWLTRSKVMKAP